VLRTRNQELKAQSAIRQDEGLGPSHILNGGFMKNFRRLLVIAAGIVLATSIPPAANAQISSTAGIVTLNATLAESLTVNVTGGATVNFTLAPNTAANAGSTTSTIQTAWVLTRGRNAVTVWAWVPNGIAALTDGTNNIPASAVSAAAAGSGSAGGALNTVTSGPGVPAFITPAAATGVQIGNVTVNGANRASSTTTTLTWNINTTFNAQLPASTYTGIVNIQAQATP
jgi:hypothetical protein